MMASPINFCSVPFSINTTPTISKKYSFNCATSFSGSLPSVMLVNPRISLKSNATDCLRPLSDSKKPR